MVRLAFLILAGSLLLAACGAKGELQCPEGTEPRIDGTCKPPPGK